MNLVNKILVKLISIITFSIIFPSISTSTLKEVQKSLQEVAYSYYMREKNIQYNPNKEYIFPPEEASEQNVNYLDWTTFTMSVYIELLNITIPYTPSHFFQYVHNHWGSPEIFAYMHLNGNDFEMNYYSKEINKYITVKNPTFKEDIIPKLQIGDVLVDEGHGVLIYDLVKDNEGKIIDAIMIHSTWGMGRSYVNSKIYTILPSGEFTTTIAKQFLNSKLNSDFGEEGLIEGSIGIKLLSAYDGWANINNPSKRFSQYVIFRVLNEDKSGNSILNFKNMYTYYTNNFTDNNIIELSNKNKERAKFRHLFIEKTVDKINNNVVEKGDNLIYQIIIKNRGKEDYKEDLIVTEKLSEFVTFKSHNENKNIINFKNDANNGILIWNIGKLKKGDEFIIKYAVKITGGNSKDIIENKGFVANIESSTVKNVIGINLKEKHMNSIKTNYEKLNKKYNGKKLINEIYKQSFGVDIEFDKFDITKLVINAPSDSRDVNSTFLNNTNSFIMQSLINITQL